MKTRFINLPSACDRRTAASWQRQSVAALLTVLLFALTFNAPRALAGIIWQENFESTAVGGLPPTLVIASADGSTFGVMTNSARSGTKSLSLKLTYAPGGKTYRAEVVPTGSPSPRYDYYTEYWVGYSQYLKDWVTDIEYEHALQAHASSANNSSNCVGPADAFSALIANGVYNYRIDKITNPNYCTNKFTSATPNSSLWSSNVVANQWVDWVVHFKFAAGTGFYELWRNGVLVASIYNLNNAPTLMHRTPANSGFDCCIPQPDLGYAQKWGIYKPRWKYVAPVGYTSREMYMDEIKVWEGPGGSYTNVAPVGSIVATTPSAPSGLSATLVSSSNQINLAWTDTSTNETQFRIERKVGVGSYAFLTNRPAIAGSGGSGTCSDLNLSAGTTYTYRVRADGTNGNSVWSSEVSTNTPGGGGSGGSTTNLYEAELLTVASNSDTVEIATDANASSGAYHLLNGAATNSFVTYTVTVTNAGTYSITTRITARSNRGIYQLKIDGVNQGVAQNYYATGSTTLYEERNLGVKTLSAGTHDFRFDCTGKDASAAQFKQGLDYLMLINTDTTAPSVSMTAPTNGASVSGTAVSVTVDAADNEGLAGVQFKLDGESLDAEDTTAPYSVVWDTTAVPDGNHTLTAVARDAAGNTTTSSEVTITVVNDPMQIGPAVITGAAVSNTNFVLTFTTDVGGQYEVQRTETLTPPAWLPVATGIPGTGDEVQVTDTNAMSRTSTFYRVTREL